MAKVGYIDLDTSQENLYFGALNPGDRFIVPHVRRKTNLVSVRRKKGVSARSKLQECADSWNALTQDERDYWKLAGSSCALTGWKLFVKDKCLRIANDRPGNSSPSVLHQALVGQLTIEPPADELKIFQPHPYSYYISKKVSGRKNQYYPLLINEKLSLPLEIRLSYKSNLVKTQSDGFAKFYAIVRRLYQGLNRDELLEINLDLQSDWNIASNTLYSVLGQYTSYILYIHLFHLTGTLFVDNIQSRHGGVNWARDPACNDIHQDFTRAFYQVPAHWSALEIPDGSYFESVFPPD